MSLERIIARLVGSTAAAEEGAISPAEGRALSQRLREIVDGTASAAGGQNPDQGMAADALKLAAYLDGSMADSERSAFEAGLVGSPTRRDELIAAAAWIDEIAARPETPPADAAALAIALETAAPAKRGPGFAGLIEWLLPGRRLAMATSALASMAILAVGVDIALRTHPQFQQMMQSQSSRTPVATPNDGSPQIHSMFPNAEPNGPAPQPGDPVVLTAETINALIAYRNDPSAERQKQLLTALARAGAAPIPADRVRAIMLQPQLYERLTQQPGDLPARISARISVAGELVIAIAN